MARHAATGQLLDVALLDLYLAGDAPAFDLVETVARNMRVLVISAKEYPADAIGAIRAGARGCLEVCASPAMLLAAIQMVASGGFAFSAELQSLLEPDPIGTPASDRSALASWRCLSLREREALHHIAQGLTHAQAANRMGVTKATIDTYVQRIKRKLGAGNKADLARLATARSAFVTTDEHLAGHWPRGMRPPHPAANLRILWRERRGRRRC
ncbi:MAG TPA: response regulator transcription factor [Streptosporangiaceae bacterium]|nr:response regulator transcription factor [Streptosporangiaceae bacterium]